MVKKTRQFTNESKSTDNDCGAKRPKRCDNNNEHDDNNTCVNNRNKINLNFLSLELNNWHTFYCQYCFLHLLFGTISYHLIYLKPDLK